MQTDSDTDIGLLPSLRIDADAVLRELLGSKARPRWDVNWANIRCSEAALVFTDDGDRHWRVTIEEASPDQSEFRNWLRRKLEDRGWYRIEVETEW